MRRKQTGRSMVEMLGVLAIIGVLSIGGLLFFNHGLASSKANKFINSLEIAAAAAITTYPEELIVKESFIEITSFAGLEDIKPSNPFTKETPQTFLYASDPLFGTSGISYFYRNVSVEMCSEMIKKATLAPPYIAIYSGERMLANTQYNTLHQLHEACQTAFVITASSSPFIKSALAQENQIKKGMKFFIPYGYSPTDGSFEPGKKPCPSCCGGNDPCIGGMCDNGICTPCPANALCSGGNILCNPGYYKVGDQCKACPANALCSGGNDPFTCYPGTVQVGNKCVPCPANSTCTSDGENITFTCNSGYYKVGDQCVPCPANSTCGGTSFTCDAGYYKDGDQCKLCPTNATCGGNDFTCNTGYFKNGAACTKCNVACTNCSAAGADNCGTCAASYFKSGTVCTKCNAVCATCNGAAATNCLTCATGYWKSGTACVGCPANYLSCGGTGFTCKSGFFKNGTACTACHSLCNGCNATGTAGCTKCIDGYFKNGTNCTACSTGCQSCTSLTACGVCKAGYWKNSSSCLACPTNYSTCEGTGFTCKDGYFKSTSAPTVCTACGGGCATCGMGYSQVACRTCTSGYRLSYIYPGTGQHSYSRCIACPTNNACPGGTNAAITCKTGYFSFSSACPACPANYSTCGGNTFTCKAGYYRAGDKASVCATCPANCTTCTFGYSQANCNACKAGYTRKLIYPGTGQSSYYRCVAN